MADNLRPGVVCYPAPTTVFPLKPEYGQCYVPYQMGTGKMFDPTNALMRGTIFADLDKPYFNPKAVMRR